MGYHYKRLISEKRFLKVQQRARKLRVDGSDLVAILYKDKELVFKTRSGTDRRIIWTQRIVLESVTPQRLLEAKNFTELEDLIKNASLKVDCDCHANLYWGFRYIAWKKGYGLVKELRKPRYRNPGQEGFVCKHLYLVLQLYPFWAKALASKFRKRAEDELNK